MTEEVEGNSSKDNKKGRICNCFGEQSNSILELMQVACDSPAVLQKGRKALLHQREVHRADASSCIGPMVLEHVPSALFLRQLSLTGTGAKLGGGKGRREGEVGWGEWSGPGNGQSLEAAIRLLPNAHPQAVKPQFGPYDVLGLPLYSGHRSK